jgi:hypothetical protein
MSDEIEKIPQSEYEYSPEKKAELYSKLNITEEIAQIEENIDSEIKEEEIKQLCIFIRNYDSDGNLVESPGNAIKTCVDTYERSMMKTTWYELEEYKNDLGIIKYRKVLKQDIREALNASTFADEEVLKVKPHIIEHRTFVSTFLREYFENFKINKVKNGKTLYIEFHNTTPEYDFYPITVDDISYFNNKNYDIIGLNLDGHAITVSENKILEMKTLSIENSIIDIQYDTGFTFSVDNLFMNEVKIKSLYREKFLATISATVKELIKLSYISFTDEICKFDFLNTSTDDMQKWMQSSVDIYGIEFVNIEKSYNHNLESLINFKGFYEVKISSINYAFDSLNMNVLKASNISNLNLTSININGNEFEKNLIILDKVTNLVSCGIYITQNNQQGRDVYAFHSSNGGIYGEHKYTAIITNKVGVLNSSGDNYETASFSNVRVNEFEKPIKWNGGSVSKMIFSNCYFDKISNLDITIPKLSIYDSNFTNIENLELTIKEKLFSSNNSLNGTNMNLIMIDDARSLISENKIRFNSFNIKGNAGSGNVNFEKSVIIGNELLAEGMNKISSSDTNFDFKDVSLTGNNISSFKPNFDNSKLKNLTLKGNIKNTTFFINNESEATIDCSLESLKGNMSLFYTSKVSNLNLNLKNCMVEFNLDAVADNENIDNKIHLKCEEGCLGSILTSYKSNFKFSPKAEGSFKDLKQITFDDTFRKNDYKDKIIYGYK